MRVTFINYALYDFKSKSGGQQVRAKFYGLCFSKKRQILIATVSYFWNRSLQN